MSDPVLIALIGAIATIVTAAVPGVMSIVAKKRAAARNAAKAKYTREAIIIGTSLVVAGGLIALGIYLAKRGASEPPPSPVAITLETKAYLALIDAAEKAKRPYVLDSVVLHVRHDDSGKPKKRRTFVRAIYTVRALRDINADEEKTFPEEFESDTKKKFTHWFGSHRETFLSPQGSAYDVDVQAKAGQRFTVMTGAVLDYTLPLDVRPLPRQLGNLQPNEDSWFYPNKEDFIGSITIVVESPTTALRPHALQAIRMRNKQVVNHDARLSGPEGSKPFERSISYTWFNLTPGDLVGLVYAW
jgi:hypothetical protein